MSDEVLMRTVEHEGKSFMQASYDGGRTWRDLFSAPVEKILHVAMNNPVEMLAMLDADITPAPSRPVIDDEIIRSLNPPRNRHARRRAKALARRKW